MNTSKFLENIEHEDDFPFILVTPTQSPINQNTPRRWQTCDLPTFSQPSASLDTNSKRKCPFTSESPPRLRPRDCILRTPEPGDLMTPPSSSRLSLYPPNIHEERMNHKKKRFFPFVPLLPRLEDEEEEERVSFHYHNIGGQEQRCFLRMRPSSSQSYSRRRDIDVMPSELYIPEI